MTSSIEFEWKQSAVQGAIDSLVMELLFYNSNGGRNVVQFTGCSSKIGTSTITKAAAAALALADWKTLLIEIDLSSQRKGHQKKVSSRKSKKESKKTSSETDTDKGIFAYLDNKEQMRNILQKTNIPKLTYVPAENRPPNYLGSLNSDKMKEFISTVKKDYDFVFIDSSPVTLTPGTASLFSLVDGIVLVAAAGRTKKNELENAKHRIRDYQDRYYGLILNKMNPKDCEAFHFSSRLKSIALDTIGIGDGMQDKNQQPIKLLEKG